MPSYTLGEIMSLATQAVRRTDFATSYLSSLVNIAYFEVAESAPHALLEKIAVSSTTSGENRITLPADFLEPVVFSLTSATGNFSGTTLRRISQTQASVKGPRPLGEPWGYTLWGNYMELVPSPDSAYSLEMRYRSQVTDMLALTDVPSLATPYRRLIVERTKPMLWENVQDWQAEQIASGRAVSYEVTVKSDEARRQRAESGMGVHPLYAAPRRRSVSSFDYA